MKPLLLAAMLTLSLPVHADSDIWYLIEIGESQAKSCTYALKRDDLSTENLSTCEKAMNSYYAVRAELETDGVADYMVNTHTIERMAYYKSFYHNIKLIITYFAD
jgi:hypothetical protein